jgi:hypothetical protein
MRALQATVPLLAAALIAGCGSNNTPLSQPPEKTPEERAETKTQQENERANREAEREGKQAMAPVEAKLKVCLEIPKQVSAFSHAVKGAEAAPNSPEVEATAIEATNKLRSTLSQLLPGEPAAKKATVEQFSGVLGEYAQALTAAGEGHATEALVRLSTVGQKFAELPSLTSLCQ